MAAVVTEKDLRRELADFQDRYPKLSDDELFILWFLRAFITEDDNDAVEALCGGSRDKGIDAVLVDHSTKSVFVVQGKYRRTVGSGNEKRADVISFAQLAVDLCGDGMAFREFTKNLLPEIEERLSSARKRVVKSGYHLQLFYVTTGGCSAALIDEAQRTVRRSEHRSSFQLVHGRQVLLLLSDYLDGVAPPVPSLDREIETGLATGASGVLQRYDSKTGIDSWVFSMTERSVVEMYKHAGVRLFARNVRGFLGQSTQVNRGMETTLGSEPEFFWYFNNGITIVCDDAERKSKGGTDILQVTNPQVINGQQTTRTLSRVNGRPSGASVLVRVIRVSREPASRRDSFETLVSKIVGATNWQNAIRASDLMCNDRRQIEIERQFRKLGYLYLRKRQSRSEALRHLHSHHQFMVRKEEIAQAVAACELDPAIVREGKEGLFEDRLYPRVFPTADPLYYLCRYWLLRLVSYCARGYPERAYAKWLVLNFMWNRVSRSIRGRAMADVFRQESERWDEPTYHLGHATDHAFKAALTFYRARRGKGQKAQDVSSFFKRKNLDAAFDTFWRSGLNRARTAYGKRIRRFEVALRLAASRE